MRRTDGSPPVRQKTEQWSVPCGHAAPGGSPHAVPPYPDPADRRSGSSSCSCSAGSRLLNLYVDWLWFGEVGFRSVYSTVLFTHVLLFVIGGLVMGGLVRLNCGSPTAPGRCSCR
jgi:hypothetical protein